MVAHKAGVGGGSLPATWALDAHGDLVVTPDNPDDATASVFRIDMDLPSWNGNFFVIHDTATGTDVLAIQDTASIILNQQFGGHEYQVTLDVDIGSRVGLLKDGHTLWQADRRAVQFYTIVDPGSGYLGQGLTPAGFTFWLDPTPGAAVLHIRATDANGADIDGQVALA